MLPLATNFEDDCDELLPDNKVITKKQEQRRADWCEHLEEWMKLICGGDTSIISQETATKHAHLCCLSTST